MGEVKGPAVNAGCESGTGGRGVKLEDPTDGYVTWLISVVMVSIYVC